MVDVIFLSLLDGFAIRESLFTINWERYQPSTISFEQRKTPSRTLKTGGKPPISCLPCQLDLKHTFTRLKVVVHPVDSRPSAMEEP